MSTFEIPTENFARFGAKMDRLARKAEKLGFPTVTWQELGRANREYEPGKWVKVVKVQVDGIAPIISGWRFVAKLEPGPEHGQNFVYHFMDEGQFPERYRTALMDCDHCGQNRDRKAVYVVQNVEDLSEFKQVGSTCLRDFTGHPSPENIARAAECILELEDIQEEFEFDGGGVRSPDLVGTERYLAWVVESVERFGWASRNAAYGTMPTADSAFVKMCDVKYHEDLTDAHKAKAKAALTWAREVLAERDNLGDYEWNLVQSVKDDTVSLRHIGIAASLIPTYYRAMEQERAAQASPSKHQGEVGKRQDWELKVVRVINLSEGRWGCSYLHKMVDKQGNEFVWVTGNRLDEGAVCKGKATVKKHSVYRGVEQTVLTRCKFYIFCGE